MTKSREKEEQVDAVPLGEAVTVILSLTVYEGQVLEHWTKEEVQRYRDGDAEARAAFDDACVVRALTGSACGSNEDAEVIHP